MDPSAKAIPPALLEQIASQCARPVPPEFAPLAGAMQRRYGAALAAVVLYGSCLRGVPAREGVVDLYAIVTNYRDAYPGRVLRVFNWLLPPNVFYTEVAGHDGPLRVKVAVISLRDFSFGTARWFHPYLWARFAQPLRLLYVRDDAVCATMHEAMARAVLTFLEQTIPAQASGSTSAGSLWAAGLALTYAAELRPERAGQADALVQADRDDYLRLTQTAIPALAHLLEPVAHGELRRSTGDDQHLRALRLWQLRRLQGRVLSILRLMKAAVTFTGGIDYAAWKIERHSGIHIEVTPEMRRRPILGGFRILWMLLKRGALR